MADVEKIRGVPFDANEASDPETGQATYDNVYYSADFAEWMRNYFSDGILVWKTESLKEQLQVTRTNETHVTIAPGNIMCQGRTGFVKEPVILDVTKATPDSDRVDRVICEIDLNDGENTFKLRVVQGTEGTPPSLVRSDLIYQMSLAQFPVTTDGIGAVTDERPDDELCGVSNVLIGIKPPNLPKGDSAINIEYDDGETSLGADEVQTAIVNLYNQFTAEKTAQGLKNSGYDSTLEDYETRITDLESSAGKKAGNVRGIELTGITLTAWSSTTVAGKTAYKSTIINSAIKANMAAEVFFTPEAIEEGLLKSYGDIADGVITVYASAIPATAVGKTVASVRLYENLTEN